MLMSKQLLLRNAMFAAVGLAFLGGRAYGYVDLAPTLGKIVSDSKTIIVVEVAAYDREKHIVTLKQVRALKGDMTADLITQQVASADAPAASMPIEQWAEPGARGVLFGSRTTSLVCMGMSWYQVQQTNGAWKIGKERPDLPLAYCGTITRLTDGVVRLAAGKDAIMTVEAYGGDDAGTSFDLAFNRTSLPGLARFNRVHMTANMAGNMAAASSAPGYLLGSGPVDEDELPALMAKLGAADATVRAEAAEDIGWLRHKAVAAVPALAGLLKDGQPRVRLAAAAAILRITPATPGAVEVLAAALDSADKDIRRDAAKAAGLAGAGAGPVSERLAALLKDADPAIRTAALISIATLGPAAAKAAPAVRELLHDPALRCDAADALGRMGPAVQPVPDIMVKMLSSDQVAEQWAAVRAMAQIGGKEAHPAVDYMTKKLTAGATEVEGYNMYLYLSMLGSVATDALPTIRNTRIKNPVLPSSTTWAIQQTYLPWQNTGGGGGFGGPGDGGPGGGGMGGGPGGMGGPGNISQVIYEAYVVNMGERLSPSSKLLATKIMDGTAGTVPDWGYQILSAAPAEAIAVFGPHLEDPTQQMRERAVVGLGFMGYAAAGARDKLAAAQAKATDDKEKLLIAWALRAIDRED